MTGGPGHSRQERRRRERELIKAGRAAASGGLSPVPKKSEIIALAALYRSVLQDPREAAPASAAALLMHAVFEASLKAHPARVALACRKGCAFCCSSWVGATAPELFLIASHLGREGRDGDDLRRRLASTAGRSIDERVAAILPCGLLADGLCSIYAVRPTTCRMTTSTDVAACEAEFGIGASGPVQGKADLDIPVSRVHLDHARNCRLPLAAAVASLGRDIDAYELGAGVLAVLDAGEGAERRWLSGEPLFAGAPKAPPEAKAYLDAVAAIRGEI